MYNRTDVFVTIALGLLSGATLGFVTSWLSGRFLAKHFRALARIAMYVHNAGQAFDKRLAGQNRLVNELGARLWRIEKILTLPTAKPAIEELVRSFSREDPLKPKG